MQNQQCSLSAGEIKRKIERRKGNINGKKCIDLHGRAEVEKTMLITEKAAVSLTPNPDAVGLGKAINVIKEKSLPACCVCAAIRYGTGGASSAVGAGPSHTTELQPPGVMQGVTLTRNELLEHPLWQPRLSS